MINKCNFPGLKKVTADQMTHKNPSLRGDGVVKAKEKSPTPGTTKVVQQVILRNLYLF